MKYVFLKPRLHTLKVLPCLELLFPNRNVMDLSNEVLNIDFDQEPAKIQEVKFRGKKKYLPISLVRTHASGVSRVGRYFFRSPALTSDISAAPWPKSMFSTSFEISISYLLVYLTTTITHSTNWVFSSVLVNISATFFCQQSLLSTISVSVQSVIICISNKNLQWFSIEILHLIFIQTFSLFSTLSKKNLNFLVQTMSRHKSVSYRILKQKPNLLKTLILRY